MGWLREMKKQPGDQTPRLSLSADVMAAAAIADCAKRDRTVTLMSTFEYDRAVLESTCAAAISPPHTSYVARGLATLLRRDEALRPSGRGQTGRAKCRFSVIPSRAIAARVMETADGPHAVLQPRSRWNSRECLAGCAYKTRSGGGGTIPGIELRKTASDCPAQSSA